MQDIESKGRLEQSLLRTSVMLLPFLAVVSFGFGIFTGSFAILFDGVYAMVDACMGALAILVSRLILTDALRREENRPGKVRYQFGFWHLEPLVLALNAILLTLTILYALGGALVLLVDEGSEPTFGWAIVYATGMALVCMVMAVRQRHRNRDLQSDFVALDAKSWLMSGSISLALLAAFIVGWATGGTRFDHWQPYVDPAILALVCIVILPLPFSDLRASVRDIFRIAPEDLDTHVSAVAKAAVAEHGLTRAYTYVASVGRSVLIEIHFVAPPGWPVTSLAQLDAIRDKVGLAIGDDDPHRWLTISFTEDDDWAN
jgi:predicted Co/Zn/Cd cation transporter (cation efflux family)